MNHVFDTVPFTATDGFACNLLHLARETKPTKGPVLLVHGAGVRANIFNPPNPHNLVATLAAAGYDVWLENWRASIDLPPNQWDLDQVALHDHPAAVQKVVEQTGAQDIKAIVHCQGSTSFMISAALGLVPEVKVIISNAVSLHPIVPDFSQFKLNVLVPVVKLFFPYLNPGWGLHAPDFKSKMLRKLVRLTHPEADTLVGKFVSFTYGSGFPALWRLENLDEETKEWIQHEFAEVPLSFFDHIKRCVDRGVLVPKESRADLPADYTVHFQSKARIVLFAGQKNLCFKAESQEATYHHLNELQPDFHQLYLLPKYSHLDVFLGKEAHADVFPLMIAELNREEPWPSPNVSKPIPAVTPL